jgi:hypothetical protein
MTHASDCAQHNAPAMAAGKCDCPERHDRSLVLAVSTAVAVAETAARPGWARAVIAGRVIEWRTGVVDFRDIERHVVCIIPDATGRCIICGKE